MPLQVTGCCKQFSTAGANVILGFAVVKLMFVEIIFAGRLVATITNITTEHHLQNTGDKIIKEN